jgi:hypothetical protein
MANELLIPADLAKAARNLEERLQLLNLEVCKFPPKDWDALPDDIRKLIPAWIPALLANYGITGAWLKLEADAGRSVNPLFAILVPEGYEYLLKRGSEYRDLVDYGFIPFALEEGSGSVWVMKVSEGPGGNVLLLDQSSWGGGEPTAKNGFVYEGKNLAWLLATVEVSDLN